MEVRRDLIGSLNRNFGFKGASVCKAEATMRECPWSNRTSSEIMEDRKR
jgi:hypothetical protein